MKTISFRRDMIVLPTVLSGPFGLPSRFVPAGLLALASFAAPSLAGTILVPDEQPTIQAGIDAAAPGDTVLVAPGTYTGSGNENIDFGGKDVVLRSSDGPAATTLQGQGFGAEPGAHAFLFQSGEPATTQVEGFTLHDFHVYLPEDSPQGGGAIFIGAGAEPTIKNCVFDFNSCTDSEGGAVLASGGTFEDCLFVDNHAFSWNDAGRGGAISCRDAVLRRCEIRGNTAIADQF